MRIHIVSSFHYDYIYLKGSEEYFRTSFRILDKALEILEREKEWCFTVEQGILLEEYLRRFPEKTEKMRRFVKEGRLAFSPGMYVMPDMNMTSGEILCLQAKFGKNFLRERLGAEAKICWIADCWGHHAQLPQLLSSCGYEGYFFWRCMRRDWKRNDFMWKGLDGTRIPAHWLSLGYAGINFPSEDELLHAEELSFASGSAENIRLLAERASSTSSREGDAVLLCNGGDFRMPQETGGAVVRRLGKIPGFPGTVFSTPERFLREMRSGELPETSGEFNGAFQGTYSSNIAVKRLLFETEKLLLAEEMFRALTKGRKIPEKTWKRLLRHYFHDSICGTVCDEGLKEILRDLKKLKGSLEKKSTFLFNPLLLPRDEILETGSGRHLRVVLSPLESGREEDFQVMEALKEENREGVFENSFFRCAYDKSGRILSLKTRGGREVADGKDPASFGLPVLNQDNGDNWVFYDPSLSGPAALTDNRKDPLCPGKVSDDTLFRSARYAEIRECRIFRSEKECVIRQKGSLRFWRLGAEFTLKISMDFLSPLVRFSLRILPSGRYFRLRAAFPTTFAGGTVLHGIPCGIQERPEGEYPAEGFVHLGDGKAGVFLLNRGLPGNNVDEAGVMLLSLFRSVAMEYKCESSGSFGEKVPLDFEYAVLPHDGTVYAEENFLHVQEYLHPLVPVEGEYRGKWDALPANVRLLSLRKHERGLFLRLCEVWGQEAVYEPPCPYLISDALEDPLSSQKRVSPLRFRPFELKNIVLVSQSKDPS